MSLNQIVSKEEMNQIENRTMELTNMSLLDLMNQIGTSLAHYIEKHDMIHIDDRILLVIGTGKNGLIAFIIGKHFIDIGFDVRFLVVGEKDHMRKESLQILLDLETVHSKISYIELDEQIKVEYFEEATIIIDGLFGTGLKKKINGYLLQVINHINSSYARVISIDIPSGIKSNNGLVMNDAVIADDTLVIQCLKQGNVLNDALDYHGTHHLVDCGMVLSYFDDKQETLPLDYLLNKIEKRKRNSHKYHYGNIAVIGGSKGYMGAPVLSGYAALKTGSGLSSVLIQEKDVKYCFLNYPELMIKPFLGIEEIPSLLKNMDTVIFGPGLSSNDDLNLSILTYLLSTTIPIVIDASGIAYYKQLKEEYNERGNIIFTPHHKELADFLDVTVDDVKEESVLLAKNIAHKYNVTVVLKGPCTIITNNEETYYSTFGNPGLATAGTGDVLAGIIGSLLGRNFSTIEAAKLGVLIHSKSGNIAMKQYGEESLTATNLIESLPIVMKQVKKQ
jgi:NAD(P)H-hydrate epimerase